MILLRIVMGLLTVICALGAVIVPELGLRIMYGIFTSLCIIGFILDANTKETA